MKHLPVCHCRRTYQHRAQWSWSVHTRIFKRTITSSANSNHCIQPYSNKYHSIWPSSTALAILIALSRCESSGNEKSVCCYDIGSSQSWKLQYPGSSWEWYLRQSLISDSPSQSRGLFQIWISREQNPFPNRLVCFYTVSSYTSVW